MLRASALAYTEMCYQPADGPRRAPIIGVTGTGADKLGANWRGSKHGITRLYTRAGLTAAGAVAAAVAVAAMLGEGNGHFLQKIL